MQGRCRGDAGEMQRAKGEAQGRYMGRGDIVKLCLDDEGVGAAEQRGRE